MDITLTKKQTIALDHLEDPDITELLFGGGAGGAKSFLGCLWIITMCIQYPGSKWVLGRSKLKALKQTTLMTFFEVLGIMGMKKDEHYKYNAVEGEITFQNSSMVILKDLFLYPADPNFDSLGSLEITGGFIDEVNQVCFKAVQIVKSRMRFKLAEFNLTPMLLMSCNPDKKWVYQEFYKPWKEGTLKPYRAFVQALAMDNPNLSPHYIEELKKLDENSKQRLLYGNWEYDSDPSKLFEYEAIMDMWSNTHIPTGTGYIFVDVARLGADQSTIYVWSGWQLLYAESIAKCTLDELDRRIQTLKNRHGIMQHNIWADEDGVGGGLVDFGGYRGFVNNSKALQQDGRKNNYANLKSQCYFEIAKKVNAGQVYVRITDVEIKANLVEDLEQIRDWNADKDDQKVRVIPKDKIKEFIGRSPDNSDAFMMRIVVELVPPTTMRNIKGLM